MRKTRKIRGQRTSRHEKRQCEAVLKQEWPFMWGLVGLEGDAGLVTKLEDQAGDRIAKYIEPRRAGM